MRQRTTRVGIHRVLLWAGAALLSVGVFVSPAAAERIKLKDGTEFSARVGDRDGANVMLVVPRASVETVDGQPLPPPVAEGYAAPAFSVTDLAGNPQALGSATGDVTVVKFWATWCPHCRNDVDLMKDLFARYQGKGVRFVTVSVDRDLNALKTFIQDRQLSYPIIAAGSASPESPESKLPDLYESRGIPAYYIVDAKGVISKTFSGSVVEGKRDLEEILKSLLPAAPSPVASTN